LNDLIYLKDNSKIFMIIIVSSTYGEILAFTGAAAGMTNFITNITIPPIVQTSALPGSGAPGVPPVAELMAELGGRPESTVYVYGNKLSAMDAALAVLKPGMRECEVLAAAWNKMTSMGSEWTQCSNIVASGPYTAPYRRFTSDPNHSPGGSDTRQSEPPLQGGLFHFCGSAAYLLYGLLQFAARRKLGNLARRDLNDLAGPGIAPRASLALRDREELRRLSSYLQWLVPRQSVSPRSRQGLF
jgi:hypothetical protein